MTAESLITGQGLLCNVERATESIDAAGSVTVTWAVNLTSKRVFIQPASGAEAVRYGRENARKFHLGYAAAGLDILVDDRLTGGGLGTRVFDIQAVRNAGEYTSGHRLAHMVLELEETD